MSQVIWVRGKALVYKCWYKENQNFFFVPDLFLFPFLINIGQGTISREYEKFSKNIP